VQHHLQGSYTGRSDQALNREVHLIKDGKIRWSHKCHQELSCLDEMKALKVSPTHQLVKGHV
jgi:hypothetical protein